MVNTQSGNWAKVFTMNRIGCSRTTGLGVHDKADWMFTFAGICTRVSAFLFCYLQAPRGHSSAPSARTGSLKTERACSRVAQYVHRRVRRRRPYWTRCLAHWKRGWPNTHGSAETPLQSLTSLSITRGDERSNNSCQRQYRIWKAARAFSACRIFTRFKVNQRAA